jgi:hypothetical protein
MSGSKLIMKIIWIILCVWIMPFFFGIAETFVRPLCIPYSIYKTAGGNMNMKQTIWFIISIIPMFMIFAMIFGLWSIIQLILNCLPYCQANCCDPLVDKKFYDNVWPLIWAPADKHPLYIAILDCWGKLTMGQPLNRI